MLKFPSFVLLNIKKFLEKRHQENQKRAANLTKEDPFSDIERLNDNSSIDTDASEQFGHERVEALKKELTETDKKIKKALDKIKKGKYGFCEKCHKLIDTDRLSMLPMAELCVNCEKNKTR